MARFSVQGPFDITFDGDISKFILSNVGIEFWGEHSEYKNRKGCYVFGIKNKNIVPYYVGHTKKTFGQEVFTYANILKYNHALIKYKKGKPVLFLVVIPIQQGQTNKREILEVEKFLIKMGFNVNDNMKNIQGKEKTKWEIKNVINYKKGAPNVAERIFKKMLHLGK